MRTLDALPLLALASPVLAGEAKVVAAEGKTHGTISSDLGSPDDTPTKELFGFLAGALKK